MMNYLCLWKKSERVRGSRYYYYYLANYYIINGFTFDISCLLENIQVQFYERDGDQVIWQANGLFSEADVHHQYGIALKTPPYRKSDIEENVSCIV